MSNTIYSIQEKLDSILDIEQTEYEYPDAELFDTSEYKSFDADYIWTPWNKGMSNCYEPETIELMSNAKLGKKQSKEHRAKYKRQGEDNNFYGKKHTPESIERMRKSSTGKKMSVESSEKKRQKMLTYWKNKRK